MIKGDEGQGGGRQGQECKYAIDSLQQLQNTIVNVLKVY